MIELVRIGEMRQIKQGASKLHTVLKRKEIEVKDVLPKDSGGGAKYS